MARTRLLVSVRKEGRSGGGVGATGAEGANGKGVALPNGNGKERTTTKTAVWPFSSRCPRFRGLAYCFYFVFLSGHKTRCNRATSTLTHTLHRK